MNLGAALIALLLAGVIKIAVLVLAVRLCFRLYRSGFAGPGQPRWLEVSEVDRPEVRLLFWSLLLFVVAELSCGVELYILLRAHPVTSIFHSVTSALGMALFAIALWRYTDRRMFHYGGAACVLNRACHGCTFSEPAGCKYRKTFWWAAVFVVFACIPPVFATTAPMAAEPARWALPFPTLNAWYDSVYVPWLARLWPGLDASGGSYYLLESVNWTEYRLLPAVALALAVSGAVMLRSRREARGIQLSLAAVGVIAYCYLDLITFRLSGDALAGGVMQEVAELWFVVFCAELLARSFGTGVVAAKAAPGVLAIPAA